MSGIPERAINLAKEGPSFGIHLIVSQADWLVGQNQALKNSSNARIELRLSDSGHTESGDRDAAGRLAAWNHPGFAITKSVGSGPSNELLVGLPEITDPASGERTNTADAALLVAQVSGVTKHFTVTRLPTSIGLSEIAAEAPTAAGRWLVPFALGETALDPVALDLDAAPNFLAVGLKGCGKDTLLETLMTVICQQFTSDQVQISVIDPGQSLFSAVGGFDQGHVRDYAYTPDDITTTLQQLAELLSHRLAPAGLKPHELQQWEGWTGPRHVVIVNDEDLLGEAIAEEAATAYRSAVSLMVPAELCLENRAEQGKDVSINPMVWGALTPDIVRLDATYYGGYWTNNAAQGITYTTVVTGFLPALGIPPPVGPPSVSPGAPAAAAEQVAEATAQSAAGDEMRSSVQAAEDFVSDTGQGSAESMLEPVLSAAQAPMGALESLGSGSGMPGMSGLSSGLATPVSQFAGMFTPLGGGSFGAPGSSLGTAALPPNVSQLAAGGGSGGYTGGGYSGAGLTSYTRPTSSFSSKPVTGMASYAKPGTVSQAGAASVPRTPGASAAPMGMMRPATGGGHDKGQTKTKTSQLSPLSGLGRPPVG